MRRRIVHPYGFSTPGMRAVSMLMALAILWALFQRMKDPATWQMLADDRKSPATTAESPAEGLEENEVIVAGPNDRDEDEIAAIQPMFQMIKDREKLQPWDMFAYWRLLQWSRTEPFRDLRERALQDVAYTQLYEQPEKYRGQPLHLRLHVQQIIKNDPKDNSYGFGETYEATGYTDQSRPYWYLVILPELPQGATTGTDVRFDLDFVGYFLKNMAYTARDSNRRALPLLMGQARLIARPAPVVTTAADVWTVVLVAVGGIGLVAGIAWLNSKSRPRGKAARMALPNEFAGLGSAEDAVTESPLEWANDAKREAADEASPLDPD